MWSDNIQPPWRPMNLHGILQDFVIGLSCEGHPGIFLVAGTSSARCRGSVLAAGTAPLCAARGKVLTAARTHVSAGHLTEKKATAQKSKDRSKKYTSISESVDRRPHFWITCCGKARGAPFHYAFICRTRRNTHVFVFDHPCDEKLQEFDWNWARSS